MIIPIISVFANAISISHTAGTVYGSVASPKHGTRYNETRSNYTACANTAAEYAGYGNSQCAYLNTSLIVYAEPASTFGHYHLYVAFAGIPDGVYAGDQWSADISYNVSQFPLYH